MVGERPLDEMTRDPFISWRSWIAVCVLGVGSSLFAAGWFIYDSVVSGLSAAEKQIAMESVLADLLPSLSATELTVLAALLLPISTIVVAVLGTLKFQRRIRLAERRRV